MAERGWLRSSPAKLPTNGSLSTGGAPSFNGSNDNLFDLLQGRLGSGSGGSIFGPASSENASPFFHPSDHQEMNDDTDSTSLLKTEDETHLEPTVEQMTMGLQPNLWPVADTSTSALLGALGSHHHGLYNNAHMPSLLPAGGMVIETCQFPSLSSLKPHDPTPQLQALRDFMAYGNNNNVNVLATGSQHHAPSNLGGGLGVAGPMFLHLGDENCTPGTSSLLQLPGMPGQMQRTLVGENSSPIRSCKPDMLAYRALCQSELFTTDRSPHRTQFQRENHILAERQRREEMNDKFSALRAMIPKATKKDKASIVGDTIGYVLELEKTLKHLQACKASRKGYFKLLKKKPSLKIAPEAAEDEECDRSMTGNSSTPLDLDSNPAVPGAGKEATTAVCELSEEPISHQHLDEKQLDIDIDSFESPIITSADDKATAACADPFQPESKDDDILEMLPSEGVGVGVCSAEVDVQNLGEQAVIKIVCARSSGLVLRILLALDECKVDVLQSNVTTVAEKSVHFITVQIMHFCSSILHEQGIFLCAGCKVFDSISSHNYIQLRSSETWKSQESAQPDRLSVNQSWILELHEDDVQLPNILRSTSMTASLLRNEMIENLSRYRI